MKSKVDKIEIYIRKLNKLPTLSYTAEKIINLTADELTHLDELVNIIEKDPPIMSKVLGVANLIYLGAYKPITSVKDALLKIGFKTLRNIALSISIFSVFKSSKEKEESYVRLFRHSIATGTISSFISERFLNESLEESFTAGVLHDIGFFVLHYAFYDYLKKIEKTLSEGSEASLKKAEEKILGTTHSKIGKWLAEIWGLPEIICEVILYHNDIPEKSEKYSETIALVQLSNFIAHQLGYYPLEVKTEPILHKESIYKILSLPEVDEIILEVKEIIKEVENL
ncbi:MAG: HDOD domain-containing protein [Thermodesulfovibrio sp.]|nr:HDOD domain-containing protein [Thermodesulfovibrio sp.]MCX7724815.1 HDOD domain-containing protein [Thermodesulfovibrio sp.]MDW7971652.1 HDOD domain-containing protein [Thermodesulfovibrio sp.]